MQFQLFMGISKKLHLLFQLSAEITAELSSLVSFKEYQIYSDQPGNINYLETKQNRALANHKVLQYYQNVF